MYDQPNFGYSGRASGGKVDMGTLYALILDYNAVHNLTTSLFLGYARGGDVQAATFTGREADYTSLQFLYHF